MDEGCDADQLRGEDLGRVRSPQPASVRKVGRIQLAGIDPTAGSRILADLPSSDPHGAELRGTWLSAAVLGGANLAGAIGLKG